VRGTGEGRGVNVSLRPGLQDESRAGGRGKFRKKGVTKKRPRPGAALGITKPDRKIIFKRTKRGFENEKGERKMHK